MQLGNVVQSTHIVREVNENYIRDIRGVRIWQSVGSGYHVFEHIRNVGDLTPVSF